MFKRFVPSLLVATLALAATTSRVEAQTGGINITNIALEGVQVVDGVLTATGGTVSGTLAGLPFTTDITNFTLQLAPDDPNTPATECSVLHLELAPINLALLGLHVDTSQICLDITATEGGGLLGDLLCGLADGAALGLPPTGDLLDQLLGQVVDLLNGLLGQGGGLQATQDGDPSVCTGACDILELVLGPVDLSLLGLNVSLDDCDEGPVQVCVSATRTEGLLGSLLCGLSGSQALNLSLADLTTLAGRALELAADGNLSRRDIGQLEALLARLIR
jgi:hypothetical protein